MRCAQLKSRRRYLYNSGLETDKDSYQTKIYQKFQTQDFFTTIPIRSYLNYLQICYYSYLGNSMISSSYDFPKNDMIEHFKYLIDDNDEFLQCFSKILIQNCNQKLLINLLLIERDHLKKFLHLNNDHITFNICILTAYDGFFQNDLLSLLFQLYFQLKSKIYSGPIDAIEQTCSYYSLNNQTILHDQSILFNSIQLIIHIDLNQKTNSSEDLFLFNLHCLTCDTISQIKEKILQKLILYKKFDSPISIGQCQLYLLTNIKSNVNSCSTSLSCSSSTTSSSNVPLAKKSLLTQFFSHRSNKYSTTTTTTTTRSDAYKDSICLLLNDIDNTNEQMNHAKKLNTLQHYGIINDGYELKMILPKQVNYINQTATRKRNPIDCYQCSSDQDQIFTYLSSLSPSIYSTEAILTELDRTRYFHLLNHTYEEIGECGHLLMDNNQSETYRLFETKSHIHSLLINLIERLFTNFLHSDNYLSELIEQYSVQFLHMFYGHCIPFFIQNLHCFFQFHLEKTVKSSVEILATIFRVACSTTRNETSCLLCLDYMKNNNQTILNQNIQNCTLLFADEIQRVRMYYTNLERRLNNKNLSSEYSSTTTGIHKTFELDNSIFNSLIEYLCTHIDEFTEVLKTQSSDNKSLIRFYNFIQMYRSSGRS